MLVQMASPAIRSKALASSMTPSLFRRPFLCSKAKHLFPTALEEMVNPAAAAARRSWPAQQPWRQSPGDHNSNALYLYSKCIQPSELQQSQRRHDIPIFWSVDDRAGASHGRTRRPVQFLTHLGLCTVVK